MIKNILVPGLNAICSRSALETALQAARLFDAHMTCLHVHPDARELARYTATLDSESGMFASQIWEAMVEGDKTAAARSRKVFDAFCAQEKLTSADKPGAQGVSVEWKERAGNNCDQTIAEAQYSDLIVFGRPAKPDDLTTNGVSDVLVDCGRPLLFAASQASAQPLTNILIAWKETAAAARAVTAAMPLLKKAGGITIAGVAESPDDKGAIENSVRRLAAALRWHGIAAETAVLEGENAGDVLLQAAETSFKAGLLVMGGYSHSRTREMIFGGFTRRVLHSAPVPIFMCH
jgi:nucleotide-binding universal stress UspA family protein